VARTVIGLDVGTAAVRAAEVRFGRGRPVLVRFAQVALDPGAVVAGEVVDAAAVGAALKRLWRDGGFKGKAVVTGVSGPRVVARTTESPVLNDSDLRSSLEYQIQELIPIPVDEAVIDHQVLETVTGPDGERLRVLVVAAHRDLVRSLLAALDAAGLSAARVDLIPFALIRALHESDFAELEEGATGATAEALVDFGAGVTNVVVHEHGIPRFLRSLATGGVELTEALVADLSIDFDEAEALKREASVEDTDRAGPGAEAAAMAAPAPDAEQARLVFRAALAPVLEEIRGSLDFWESQSGGEQLRRVLLTGGAARPAIVAERLERLLGVPVERGDSFARVDPEPAKLGGDATDRAREVGAVAVGLALSGEALAAGARRINLLPGEIAIRRRERRQVYAAAAAVAVFAGLLMGLYSLRNSQVRDAERDATAAEARTTQLQAEVAQLQDVEALESDISRRRQTVISVLEGDIAWVRLIQEIATVIPDDVWLTAFSGSRDSGQLTFAGMGFDQTSTAHWIIRMSDVESLRGLWVPSSQRTGSGGQDLVSFSSNAELTEAARSNRASRYGGQQ